MDEALFNHLALPPRLPHGEDPNLDAIEASLVDWLIDGARFMQERDGRGPSTYYQGPAKELTASAAWSSILQCLVSSKAVNRDGRINRTRLLTEMSCMTGTNALVLHIRSQNAALLIHRFSEYVQRSPLVPLHLTSFVLLLLLVSNLANH